MNVKSLILPLILLLLCLCPGESQASEDMDWQWGIEPVYSQGADKPADGKLWGIAARKDDVQITFRLEAKNDLTAGQWIGDIRAPKKFYAKFRLINHDDHQVYFQIEDAKAIGPDAEYGSWKDGPETAPYQTVAFKFNWEMALKIRDKKTLILNIASVDAPKSGRDIHFPLDNFKAKLLEMETAIRSVPGADKYLLTDSEIKNMPITQLPVEIRTALSQELDGASKFLGRDKSDLMKLSFTQIEDLIDVRKQEKNATARAAKKAEFQAIYDQKPDWRDLNVCPKPDVKYCNHIGRKGYEVDNMFNMEFDYGEIIGVVWRSEGSIIHIYGGDLNYGIEPEIVRAKTNKYYYVLENDNGVIQIRAAKTMQLR